MKKIFTILLCSLCFSLFAKETKLLDFTKFNEKTDLSSFVENLTDEQKTLLSELAYSNQWKSECNSAFLENASKKFGNVLLVNGKFPNRPYSFFIEPPFTAKLNEADIGLGKIKNIGEIREITLNVSGINRRDDIFVVLNINGQDKNFKMTKAEQRINGAETLVWKNENYLEDAEKRELKQIPYFPQGDSTLEFKGFIVRSEDEGEFAIAFSDLNVIYDVLYLDQENDVEFEEIIKSDSTELDRLKRIEAKKVLDRKILIELEKNKIHK